MAVRLVVATELKDDHADEGHCDADSEGAQDTLHAELDEELQNLLTGGEACADAEADESHRDTQHAFNHGVHEKTFQVRGDLPIMRSHPPMRVSLAGHSGALGTERFNSVHNH